MTPNANLAQIYAADGYRVLPIGQTTKRPTVPGGFHAATDDAGQIAGWWRQWPLALPGIACERFWVLDVDHPSNGSREALAAILARFGMGWALGACRMIVHTPSGGAHCYYRRPHRVPIAPRAGDIAVGIDTRGHDEVGNARSYIIAPGAKRPDGSAYRIVEGSLDALELAPRRLLALAVFNARERSEIAAAPKLREEINAATPDRWRGIYDRHAGAVLAERLRHAPTLSAENAEPMRRQALADLTDQAGRLAGTKDGRKVAIFKAGCALGRYVAGGVLSEAEVTAALLNAWADSGAAQKHGVRYGAQQVAAGLLKAAGDPLPRIARRFRNASPVALSASFVSRPLQRVDEVTS